MKAGGKSVEGAGLGEGDPSLGLSCLICKIRALYQMGSVLRLIVQLRAERREEGRGVRLGVGGWGGDRGASERALPGSAASQREPPMVASLVEFALNLIDKLINVETVLSGLLLIKSNPLPPPKNNRYSFQGESWGYREPSTPLSGRLNARAVLFRVTFSKSVQINPYSQFKCRSQNHTPTCDLLGYHLPEKIKYTKCIIVCVCVCVFNVRGH